MKLIGIFGLGYVGLPLAIALASKHKVLGFDINKKRIKNLKGANCSIYKLYISNDHMHGQNKSIKPTGLSYLAS